MAGDFNRRLARIEKRLGKELGKLNLRNCNCREVTYLVEGKEQEFEAEMNRSCPAHGFRDLGIVVIEDWHDSRAVQELQQEYHRRHVDAERARAEQKKKIREELLSGVIQEERLAM